MQLELLHLVGGHQISLEHKDVALVVDDQIPIVGQNQDVVDPGVHLTRRGSFLKCELALPAFVEVKDDDTLEDVADYDLVLHSGDALHVGTSHLAVELGQRDFKIVTQPESEEGNPVVLAKDHEGVIVSQGLDGLDATLKIHFFQELDLAFLLVKLEDEQAPATRHGLLVEEARTDKDEFVCHWPGSRSV